MFNESIQNCDQEDVEILDAQEVKGVKEGEGGLQEVYQDTGSEVERRVNEFIIEGFSSVPGESEHMHKGTKVDEDVVMNIDMQEEEEAPEQVMEGGIKRERRVRLLNRKNGRGRQPLQEIQNLELRKGLSTKRKLNITDEEMPDLGSTEQMAKRNKLGEEGEDNGQMYRVEETSPSWSLNNP